MKETTYKLSYKLKLVDKVLTQQFHNLGLADKDIQVSIAAPDQNQKNEQLASQ